MAFESLTEKLNAAFKKLRGKGRLKEADIREAMREVRLALLEADVGFKVVRDFVKTVSERSLGADVLESLTPAQMVIKIVNEELSALMGGENAKITISSKPPTIIMLIGLQGSGKTTNAAKLAAYMRPIRHGQITYTVQPRTATALRFQRSIVRRCYRSLELAVER